MILLMATWIWLNLVLAAFFFAAMVGIPLWLVFRRPDTGPKPAELAVWHRWHAARGRRRQQRAAAPRPGLAQSYRARELGSVAKR